MIPGLLTDGPYAGQWYRCAWCRKRRAVGYVHRCKANSNWSPAPWGATCEPDADGIRAKREEVIADG